MTEPRPDSHEETTPIPVEDTTATEQTAATEQYTADTAAPAGEGAGAPHVDAAATTTLPPAQAPGQDAAAAVPAAGTARMKKRPWYRRTWVAVVGGIAIVAASFGAGWAAHEVLSPDTPAVVEQGDFDPGQGGPGGGGQMPDGGPGQMPGGQMPDGSGGGGRTTPDDGSSDDSGGGTTSEDEDSTGVLQNESTSA
ncbi:hypothetical protein [Actinomyces sp. MRS3W]|uniref:hypothetical protein n=1 Tax=Actinomyces sp. MRS3W TaxID=2800796 RepID=UPI0028FD5036|nr:hypothetical protein [Actinomyces sp. MRS3W]MDU0348822.1 hypothetical protein [Actinomyces sp. MRS3W]